MEDERRCERGEDRVEDAPHRRSRDLIGHGGEAPAEHDDAEKRERPRDRALRPPDDRFAAALSFAASLTSTLFTTCFAPALFASRVAVPLCCSTSVFPLMVATPPWTCTSNLFFEIFEAANRARIAFSTCVSSDAECPPVVFLAVGEAGLAAGAVWLKPAAASKTRQESIRYIGIQIVRWWEFFLSGMGFTRR